MVFCNLCVVVNHIHGDPARVLMEKMEPMLDPEQQNVARLEAGGSSSVDFVDGHVYVALRVNEDGR